jgi:type II secretory pathway pseudopilin PulG
MRNNPGCRGFTYLAALMVVVIMGIMLGVAGQSWKTVMRREREAELIFRGVQYRDAIARWYKEHPDRPLQDLNNLLQDPLKTTNFKYLRRLYTDPMTGKEWNVVKDPALGISGVFSASQDQPYKTGNFPDDLQDLAGKTKYSDWQFIYKPPATQPGTGATPGNGTTLGTTTPGTTTPGTTKPGTTKPGTRPTGL